AFESRPGGPERMPYRARPGASRRRTDGAVARIPRRGRVATRHEPLAGGRQGDGGIDGAFLPAHVGPGAPDAVGSAPCREARDAKADSLARAVFLGRILTAGRLELAALTPLRV